LKQNISLFEENSWLFDENNGKCLLKSSFSAVDYFFLGQALKLRAFHKFTQVS